MKRFVFHVRVDPADTRKAVGLLKGSAGVNTLAAFAGWCHATPLCGSGTEIVRHVTIEDSTPATGIITASVTVDGVLASDMYTTEADATQAMTQLASLLQGALQQGGVSGTVSYGTQDYNANYGTATRFTNLMNAPDVVEAVDTWLKWLDRTWISGLPKTLSKGAADVVNFVKQGVVPALIVTAVGAILFLTATKAITE